MAWLERFRKHKPADAIQDEEWPDLAKLLVKLSAIPGLELNQTGIDIQMSAITADILLTQLPEGMASDDMRSINRRKGAVRKYLAHELPKGITADRLENIRQPIQALLCEKLEASGLIAAVAADKKHEVHTATPDGEDLRKFEAFVTAMTSPDTTARLNEIFDENGLKRDSQSFLERCEHRQLFFQKLAEISGKTGSSRA